MSGFIYFPGDLAYLQIMVPRPEYVITTPAAAPALLLDDVKTHLRISLSETGDDTYITNLISAITTFTEQITRRDLINKTWTAYLDRFPPSFVFCDQADNGKILIERSRLQSITSIKYLVDNVLVTIDPATYYFTISPDFSSIYLVNGQSWPSNADVRKQVIQIAFVSGFGATNTSVPQDLKFAMMQHIAAMYENRGDCMDCAGNLPQESNLIYMQYKINKVGL